LKKILIIVVLGISGCASMAGTVVQQLNTGGVPGDNKIHCISAGGVLYSKFKYVTSPGAKVTSKKIDVSMGVKLLVPKVLILTKMGNDSAYCGGVRVYALGSTTGDLIYACFFDANNDGVFEDAMWGGSRTSLNDKTKYVKVDQTVTNVDGFKREILFQGRTEKTIKLKYREFMNDMARPAYSQDIEYFIDAKGTTSGNFKGLKIEVISIEGNYIKYRVQGDIDK